MPLYPAIITTSVILSVGLSSVTLTLLPVTALVIALGTISSQRMFKPHKRRETKERTTRKNILYNLFQASWPILLVVALVLLGLDAVIAFLSPWRCWLANKEPNGRS